MKSPIRVAANVVYFQAVLFSKKIMIDCLESSSIDKKQILVRSVCGLDHVVNTIFRNDLYYSVTDIKFFQLLKTRCTFWDIASRNIQILQIETIFCYIWL